MRNPLLLLALFFIISCNPDDNGTDTTIVTVSIQNLSVDEGNEDNTVAVELTLNRASDAQVIANISSTDVSATAGEDYESFENAMVIFEPGDLTKEYSITLKGDEDEENDEAFEVDIVSVEGGGIAKGKATVTIIDDEPKGGDIVIPTTGFVSADSYPGMDLVWQDEFNDASIDESKWNFEIGTGSDGWGNNELQYYKKENAYIVDGNLVIEAKEENFGGQSYTSSRMTTQNNFDFKYGRVDIRANVPLGKGIWPALWMLGANFPSTSWPACGEIDIMELVGDQPSTVYGTTHWQEPTVAHAEFGGNTTLSSGVFKDNFHVFSIIWDESLIRWFVDDVQYHAIDISPDNLSEFRANFFLIFNVAVGGNWPGSPDGTTVFPQHMIVDYIRVFQ